MPRPKTRSDHDVLETALKLIHEQGPEALTFAHLSEACGLSPATLVQRFETKAKLKQAALLNAWNRLDERTAALAAETPNTPEGAIAMLVGLSHYGDIESYAEGLLVLREDLRDPALRARGAAWKAVLSNALEGCFAQTASAPPGIGLLLASQWQGSLIWWAFDPQGKIEAYIQESLQSLVSALLSRGSQP